MNNALIFGTFDGVHLGHRSVIESVKGHNIIAVTFRVPPKSVTENKQNLLMLYEKRVDALNNAGVNEILLLEFENVKDTEHTVFLNDMIKRYAPKKIACGFNFKFGKDALGDTGYLKDVCKKTGIEFCCSENVKMYGNTVSSSYIRSLVENGRVDKANTLMSEDFGFKGVVIKGDGRGATLGFPTANQLYPNELVKAKFGVYKSEMVIENKTYNAITNVGVRPTFKTECVTAETFVFGYNGDLYGTCPELKLKSFLREEKKFSGEQELKEAILTDINKVRQVK